MGVLSFIFLVQLWALSDLTLSADLSVFYTFEISYITASPLGVPQQVIAINGNFPGPTINVTTNNILVVNVRNKLDEPFLMSWDGIQLKGNSWQDGVSGTNCPIPPNWNWTYNFQIKDQIGSYFYFPSLGLQRASGAYGGITVNNRDIIALPFSPPSLDITMLIGDWYTSNHMALRKKLDDGIALDIPDGVLINGKGPCQYNTTLVPAGILCEQFQLTKGKTYRLRVHNVGVSTSLNFRIQGHTLTIVETEGSYTIQQNYTSFDIHVGQSYSFLLNLDQSDSDNYYVVASARFVNDTTWEKVTGVSLLCYHTCDGKELPAKLPMPPQDQYDKTSSMNQARSIRWNLTASGARPNPQGSFKYGSIIVTDFYVLKNKATININGKQRRVLNMNSYVEAETPIRLADQFKLKGVYNFRFPNSTSDTEKARMDTSIINGTYKGFMEIILQNNDTKLQSYHLDGYAFFVVGMDYGEWTENSRGTYNKWDGIARCTTQVFPGAWTAILISLDNVGVWNLRAENLDSWYLGQQTYIRVVNLESNETESTIPDNVLYCGQLYKMQKPQKGSSTAHVGKLLFTSAMIYWVIFILN